MSGKAFGIIIVALIGGIIFGNASFSSAIDAVFPIILASGAFGINFFLSRKSPFHNFNWLNDASAFFLFLGIGVFSSAFQKPSSLHFPKGNYAFSGKVEDYTPTSYGDKLLIDLTELNYIGDKSNQFPVDRGSIKALITLQDATDITYGSTISGFASLQSVEFPSNFRNDDYISYLKNKHIFLTGFTEDSKCNFSSPGFSFLSFFKTLRDKLEAVIESSFLTANTKSFLISVLLGDKSYINKDNRLVFSDAGVAHIFAVSGLHVSLISMALIWFFSIFLFGKARNWKFLICLPLIWFYILLVGMSPATCRAGIMLSIAFVSFFLQRKHNALKALGWSIILILSFVPAALFDIGFQLSVICVGSLILIASPLNTIDHRSHPKLFALVSLILVSVIATFSSWMVCAFYFHRFSLMFLPMNLIAVPLLPVFLILSVVYIGLFSLGLNVPPLAALIDYFYDLFQKGASHITSLSSPFENMHPHFSAVVCWIMGLILLALFLNRQKKRLKHIFPALLFFGLSALIFAFYPTQLPNGFILQKNSTLLSIMNYDNGNETQVVLPDGDAVSTVLNGHKILALKSENISKSTQKALADADYVMLCKGCKSLPDDLPTYISSSCRIVTHPSLHWRHEKNIIKEASEKNLNPYSLRYDGPLHVFD